MASFTGTNGPDALTGGAGDDTLSGLGGDDTLIGLGGNDSFMGGPGTDSFEGGDGSDTIDYSGTAQDTVLSLNDGTLTVLDADGNPVMVESLTSIENAVGGTGNDLMSGSADPNVLQGLAGNDDLRGGNENDTLFGGDGNDALHGGGHNDSLSGDAGNDSLYGAHGDDTLSGGDGDDLLHARDARLLVDSAVYDPHFVGWGAGNDELSGGAGNDTLVGGDGNDTLDGGFGTDLMDGGAGIDTVDYAFVPSFSAGSYELDLATGVATFVATDGTRTDTHERAFNFENAVMSDANDTVLGNDADNRIESAGGNDVAYGGAGADTLLGGAGTDTLAGGTGADTFAGTQAELAGDTIVDLEDGDVIAVTDGFATAVYDGRAGVLTLDGTTQILMTGAPKGTFTESGSTLTFVSDLTAPTVSTITRDPSADALTNADTVTFTVTFDGPVMGIDAGDFTVSGTGSATGTVSSVSAGSGDSVTVTVTGVTGDGELGLDIAAGTDIYEASGHTLTVSEPATDETYTLDNTVAKPAVTVPIAGDGMVNASEASAVVVTGSGAEAGATVQVVIDEDGLPPIDRSVTVTADSAGTWSATLDITGLADGPLTVAARQTDLAGNRSGWMREDATYDATAPAVTVDDLTTTDTTPALSGTLDDLTATISVTVDGQTHAGTNNGDGTWTLADDTLTALAYGTFDVQVTATDTAGNIGTDGSADELTVSSDFYGTPGNDTWAGTPHDNTAYGRAGNDDLAGRHGNDTILGEEGDDTLHGNSADDSLSGGDGADVVRGGLDTDVVDGDDGDDVLYGDNGWDTYTPAQEARLGADTLNGGAGNDTMYGEGGNDSLVGRHGDDVMDGGTGDDTLHGNSADDTVSGGAGADVVRGGLDTDVVNGDDGDDVLYGDNGWDTYTPAQEARLGADTLDGGAGNDTLYGEGGNDLLYGRHGNDVVEGGSGDDTLYGNASDDTVSGGDGDDLVYGSMDTDLVNGGDGDDVLYGDNGADSYSPDLEGRLGADTLNGGAGDDTMYGEGGNDSLTGEDGADLLEGGDGDDFLRGDGPDSGSDAGDGNDTLRGGDGNDSLGGNGGDDSLFGGAGDDGLWGADGNDSLYGEDGADSLVGGAGDDFLRGDGPEAGADAGDGNDTLEGLAGDDSLSGNGGDDLLSGGDGDDAMWGSAGNDTLIGGAGDDELDGNSGDDSLTGEDGADLLEGGSGDDFLRGDGPDSGSDAGDGNDTLRGGDGNDSLGGNGGDDSLSGDAGDDGLWGADGNDTLAGGAGTDTLTGGAGTDQFTGTLDDLDGDTIADLTVGESIVVDGTVDSVDYTGGVLTLNGSTTLTIEGAPAGRFEQTGNTLVFQDGDAVPPTIEVNPLTTGDTTPELTGTVDDADATISITVDGQTLDATNNGDGTWTLPDDALSPLAEGTYDVTATATDSFGNSATDDTDDELTIATGTTPDDPDFPDPVGSVAPTMDLAILGGSTIAIAYTNESLPDHRVYVGVYEREAGGFSTVVAPQPVADPGAGIAQFEPDIAPLEDGGFVVAWTDDSGEGSDTEDEDVWIRVFEEDGGYRTDPINLSEMSAGADDYDDQDDPSVAGLSDGGFVVAWEDERGVADGSLDAVMAQVFDADGTARGPAAAITTTTAGQQDEPDIAALHGGGYVIVWEDDSETGGDTDGTAVRGQIFDETGAAVGDEVLVNDPTNGTQDNPQVAALCTGAFVVTWEDDSKTAPDLEHDAIRARMYTPDGSGGWDVGTPFLVNTTTADDQEQPVIAALDGGGFVILWEDESAMAGGGDRVTRFRLFDDDGNAAGDDQVLVLGDLDGTFDAYA